MKLICNICQKEFEGTLRAKYCSTTCRSKAFRATETTKDATVNATQNESIPVRDIATETTTKPVNATQTPPLDYYHSKEYLDLIKHLEETSIKDLEKEGTYIPCWKYAGYKKRPDVRGILK